MDNAAILSASWTWSLPTPWSRSVRSVRGEAAPQRSPSSRRSTRTRSPPRRRPRGCRSPASSAVRECPRNPPPGVGEQVLAPVVDRCSFAHDGRCSFSRIEGLAREVLLASPASSTSARLPRDAIAVASTVPQRRCSGNLDTAIAESRLSRMSFGVRRQRLFQRGTPIRRPCS